MGISKSLKLKQKGEKEKDKSVGRQSKISLHTFFFFLVRNSLQI